LALTACVSTDADTAAPPPAPLPVTSGEEASADAHREKSSEGATSPDDTDDGGAIAGPPDARFLACLHNAGVEAFLHPAFEGSSREYGFVMVRSDFAEQMMELRMNHQPGVDLTNHPVTQDPRRDLFLTCHVSGLP